MPCSMTADRNYAYNKYAILTAPVIIYITKSHSQWNSLYQFTMNFKNVYSEV